MKQMKRTPSKGIAKVIAVFVTLALCLPPAPAHAEAARTLAAPSRSEAEIAALVDDMLAAGDYVEGEAIVCVLAGKGNLTAQSGGPLDGAESLSEVTARQYAEATGEAVPLSVDGPGTLTAQAPEKPVLVQLVRSDTLGTEELLDELLSDPRVLSAEPNYLMEFAEDTGELVPEGGTLQEDAAVAILADETDDAVLDVEASAVSPEESALEAPEEEVAGLPADGADELPEAASPEADVVSETLDDVTTATSETATPESVLVAQDDHTATQDLTSYQWFSVGVDNTASQQHLAVSNPGMHSPHWNEKGTTNAGGAVAIMDSGIDYRHPDLENVMYHFSPELQEELGCGEFGYAPQREDKTDPMDFFGHGTHCAGIVGAEWNDFGVSGTASGTKLIAVSLARGMDYYNSGYTTDTIIRGYDFLIRAAEAGVDIRSANRSLGLGVACNADEVMIRAAGEAGIITCIASGNNRQDHDKLYDDVSVKQPNPYVLRVNASDRGDAPASFSDYGTYTTDVFAPGATILSTVPSKSELHGHYFASADSDPLYLKTDFSDGAFLDISGAESFEVKGLAEGDMGFDGDGSSLKASVATWTESATRLLIDIPVGDVGKDDVQDISFVMNTDKLEAGYGLSCCVLLDDGSYSDDLDSGIQSKCFKNSRYDWCFFGVHVDDPDAFEQDFGHVQDKKGNTCIRLRMTADLNDEAYSAHEPVEVDLYFDQIAIGRRGNSGYVPYEYMNGTSMAAPCVAGCAAIASELVKDADAATRAAQTVRLLKAAVRQADGYWGFCKQNGQIDLALLGNEDALVPVIESAQTDGEALVIDGAYFSSGGTLLVAGEEAEILSWTDESIVAVWPAGLTSGLIPLAVRTEHGAEVCRAFIIEAPESVENSAELYERELTAVDFEAEGVSPANCPDSIVATEDGVLFAAVEDASEQRIRATVHHLAQSDDLGESWTYEDLELPKELRGVSLATGDGKVFVLGSESEGGSDVIVRWNLYSMDIASKSFELLGMYERDNEEPQVDKAILAYAGGQLFFVDYYRDPDEYDAPTHIRMRRLVDADGTLADDFLLDHDYTTYEPYYPPLVSVAGNRIYVFSGTSDDSLEEPAERLIGLECVEVAADGSLSCTDLSAAFDGLETGVETTTAAIAACDEGVYLVSSTLGAQLSEDADLSLVAASLGATPPTAYGSADTFFLEDGATTFEPYAKRLSFAPFTMPVAVCADGWLHAFAVSKYEDMSVFGRATKYAEEEPEPEPTPEPTPTPEPKPSDDDAPARRPSSRSVLPQTDDPGIAPRYLWILAISGLLCIAVGRKMRRASE